jgi:phage shock protein PspC (stress-responsive transcriptional regulator)
MELMEQNNTTTEAPPEPKVVAQEELIRPTEGRVIAGVAQGLANRFNIAPWVVRAVFILLAFAGGAGVALYAAGWFLIRSEEETESAAERVFTGATTSRSWIGIGLVFLAALILLDNFTFLSGGVVWAVGLLIVGFLLYTGDLPRLMNRSEEQGAASSPNDKEGVQQMTTDTGVSATETLIQATTPPSGGTVGGGVPPTPTPTPPILPPAAHKPREHSFLGRLTIGFMLLGLGVLALLDNLPGVAIEPEPRHYMALAVTILGIGLVVGAFAGRARWLIVIGMIMVPTLLFSPVFEYEWTHENFERSVTPDTFAEVENGYSLDVGNLFIDLTQLPWNGQTIEMSISVDAGNVELRLPEGVGLIGSAEVSVGRVAGPGRESSGLGNPALMFNTPGPRGTVNLDARVDIGNIEISRG